MLSVGEVQAVARPSKVVYTPPSNAPIPGSLDPNIDDQLRQSVRIN